jgi:hypothetical protein
MFDTYVSGIPCAVVFERFSTPGNRMAESDWDYEGHDSIEWHLVDRKGYPANWLEKKLTQQEIQEIERQIRRMR